MAEKTNAVAEAVPVTGPGSAAGLRWFVSCRYPNYTVTIKPAEHKTDTTPAVKGVYAIFRSTGKPNELQGSGHRRRGQEHLGDENMPRKWGIFGPIMDPGEEPEGGFTDDGRDVPADRRLKAKKKKENREIIDHLRDLDIYRKTPQNDRVDAETLLVELTWNPVPHSGQIAGVVTRGRPSIGKDGVNDGEKGEVAPPPETRAPAAAPKAPSLGRKAG